METLAAIRTCKECGAALHGRTDQKYCTAMCKTAFNNRKRTEELRTMPECISTIQKTLLNNYKILTALRQRGEQFSLMYLEDLGFSLRHLTAVTQKDGVMRCHCFNECYLLTGQAMILIND